MKKSMVYEPVSLLEFEREFDENRNARVIIRDNCSKLTVASMEGCVAFLDRNRLSGFCIHVPTEEIRFLHSIIRGKGGVLIQEAVKRGGKWLTCFDGYLTDLYTGAGFQITRREPNWIVGQPDVLTMTL